MKDFETVESVERYVKEAAAKLDHFWYDGMNALAININLDDTLPAALRPTIELRLTLNEMRRALQRLDNEDDDESTPDRLKGETTMWWAYECLEAWPVPMCIYRDDYFSVHVPHHVGQRIIAIMKERLAECESVGRHVGTIRKQR